MGSIGEKWELQQLSDPNCWNAFQIPMCKTAIFCMSSLPRKGLGVIGRVEIALQLESRKPDGAPFLALAGHITRFLTTLAFALVSLNSSVNFRYAVPWSIFDNIWFIDICHASQQNLSLKIANYHFS